MPTMTSKSHKSRKTDDEPQPRQRASKVNPFTDSITLGSSLVLSPSSEVPVATAAGPSDNSDATVPQEKPREEQSWYRKPDSKLRGQSAKIAVMRAAGHKTDAIAKRLKTSDANIRFVEFIARKNGWYDEDDQPVDVEAELAFDIDRKIVRNISASLDGQMTNWQTHEMTIQAAKGRGVFKSSDRQEAPPQLQVVAIQVVMPSIGVVDQQIVDANVGGTPAYLEGEVDEFQSRHLGGEADEGQALGVQHESQPF